jgi:hypothetical protein
MLRFLIPSFKQDLHSLKNKNSHQSSIYSISERADFNFIGELIAKFGRRPPLNGFEIVMDASCEKKTQIYEKNS